VTEACREIVIHDSHMPIKFKHVNGPTYSLETIIS